MAKPEILVGCDPEVFVFDTKADEYISAHGLIPGTKDAPHDVENGMVQVDGMALEFGIDPAPDEDTFFNNIQSVMKQMQAMLPKHYQLHAVPIAHFRPEIMDAQPAEALELGCEPDFNAYTLRPNPRPNAGGLNMRSGGGHVHIGWGSKFDILDERFRKSCATLIAELDYTIGIPSLHWDSDGERRRLYGMAGAFRPKSYGCEYRSLSNRWVASEEHIRFVFRNTLKAVNNLLDDRPVGAAPVQMFQKRISLDAQTIINSGYDDIGSAMYV